MQKFKLLLLSPCLTVPRLSVFMGTVICNHYAIKIKQRYILEEKKKRLFVRPKEGLKTSYLILKEQSKAESVGISGKYSRQ